MSQAEGLAAARRLFGCYRKDDAADPDVYLAATTAIFCKYPKDVVQRAIDPREGLPTKQKWLPTVSEIHAECAAIMAADAAAEKRRADLEAQINRRQESPRAERPTYEELKAKYGPNWGLSKPEEDIEAKQRQREQIDRANKVLFERENSGNPWASSYLLDMERRRQSEAAE